MNIACYPATLLSCYPATSHGEPVPNHGENVSLVVFATSASHIGWTEGDLTKPIGGSMYIKIYMIFSPFSRSREAYLHCL